MKHVRGVWWWIRNIFCEDHWIDRKGYEFGFIRKWGESHNEFKQRMKNSIEGKRYV